MDPQSEELNGFLHQIKFNDQMRPILSSSNFVNSLKLQDSPLNLSFANHQLISPNSTNNLVVPSLGLDSEGARHEDYDYDAVLKYVNQVLMEEDESDKFRSYLEPSVLEAAEKSLYEVLGQKYPPLHASYCLPQTELGSLNESSASSCVTYSSRGANSGRDHVKYNMYGYHADCDPQPVDSCVSSLKPSLQTSYFSPSSSGRQVNLRQSNTESSFSSIRNAIGLTEVCLDSPVSNFNVSDMFNDSRTILQFQKGLEEARKFLPKSSFYAGLKEMETLDEVGKLVASGLNGILTQGRRGKKHREPEQLQPEVERNNKQSAVLLVSDEAVMRSEMFDKVLLSSKGKNDAALRQALQSELNTNVQNAQARGLQSRKGRGKKQGRKRNVVDLRSLLSQCAQAVASNDQRSANALLQQIRQHSSPQGDGNQRTAHYFADGLEARLAGLGTPIYDSIVTGPASAVDILRAYHMFLAVCPFKKLADFFSNRTIMAVAEKATCLHIIDLGMIYGFQWPCLMQRLSTRPGGPPKLRITGIDIPQPGFRPAKRLEETGCRLRNYADSFNVPFEFNAVAKKWESLSIEDLKIESDELLVANCLFRFKCIPEETVLAECPRDIVLNLIKQIKPAVFIHGVVNGAFNSPFFITRFREALFHFSTLFDMLEATLPRDIKERTVLEEIFGRQAMNVIACEGLERIERPETYKQWQVRNERAGFKLLPLNRNIVEMIKGKASSVYHKDFSIDEDGQWLLQGWKGRIIYALSTWKP